MDTSLHTPLRYVHVREDLKRKISRMKHGQKLDPERRLAELYGVDRTTIRRAASELEKEGFVVRHQGKGTFVRKLAERNRAHPVGLNVIGLVMPGLEIPMHLSILRGVEELASERGYQCWVRNCLFSAQREMQVVEKISKEELAGIVTCPVHDNVIKPEYAALLNRIVNSGKKVVLMDQYVPGVDVPVAMVDKFKVGYIATEHLVMLGHRRICYLSTHGHDSSGDMSHRGYCQALEDYGIDYTPELALSLPAASSAEPTYQAIRKRLTENPRYCTAIATPQFAMSYGVYRALRDLGIRIGRDMDMVGNNLCENPELEHISHTYQPYEEAARAAIELLLSEPNTETHRKHALIPPRLVMGKVDKDRRNRT